MSTTYAQLHNDRPTTPRDLTPVPMPDILAQQPFQYRQGQDHELKSEVTDELTNSPKASKDNAMLTRPPLGRGRKNTTIDSVASYPGSVRINAEGAFIVDEDPSSPSVNGSFSDGTKEIRLPHQSPVSHIAVDVSVHSSITSIVVDHLEAQKEASCILNRPKENFLIEFVY